MSLPRARILRGVAGTRPEPTRPYAVRLPAEVAAAHAEAARIVARAEAEGHAVLMRAKETVEARAAVAAGEAREAEMLRLVAVAARLEARERAQAEGEIERITLLARLLAERVIHAEIAASPTVVGAMARELVAEARGARAVVVHVCPADVLEVERAMLAAGRAAVSVRPDASLGPGSMIVTSDVGTVDGRVEVLLPRLVSVLVEALENG